MANRVVVLVLGALVVCGLSAQDPVTLKVETRAVQIHVAVKDSQGHPVRGLRKEDFTVTDNGRRREINLFSSEEESSPAARPVVLPPNVFSNRFGVAAAPSRITAILIDGLNTAFEQQSYTRAQAIKAVENMTPGDSIALYSLSEELSILQNYTTDRDRLLKALHGFVPIQPPMPDRSGEGPFRADAGRRSRGSGTPRAIAQILMRERIEVSLEALRTIAAHMAAASGRKSILWLSAGFPPSRNYQDEVDSTITFINNANVAIYAVDARGLMPGRNAINNIQLMQELAQSTGGEAFYNRNDLDHAIQEAVEDSRFTYSLAFYLPEQDLDGQYHNLNVKVDRPGLELHYRRGYDAVLDPKTSSRNKEGLVNELLNPVDRAELGMTARLAVVGVSKKSRALRITLVLDPETVTQTQPDGVHAMKLNQLFLVTDKRGRVLSRLATGIIVTIPAGQTAGPFSQNIALHDGSETLQIVMRDLVSGHTGSLTAPLAGLAFQ